MTRQRLLAILSADAAGFSRLMFIDEPTTVSDLEVARGLFRARIKSHGGRLVDTAGDSVLAVFETAAGAAKAALDVQRDLQSRNEPQDVDRRMEFRIGLHLGDVIKKRDGTVYGSGVNVAARLQSLAEPGGIVTSESFRCAIGAKLGVEFEDLGLHALKNVPEPVNAHWMRPASEILKPQSSPKRNELSLPDKPSVAVLAFDNIGDSSQEFFTDGICEDIITELSRFHELFVISRNSSFAFKSKAVDACAIAKELGVRYIVQGSMRREGPRVRVTAQLIDATSGFNIWAKRYDRQVEDIFAVQDEVAESVVRAIAPQVLENEARQVLRRHPESLRGYEIAVRAHTTVWQAFVRGDLTLLEDGLSVAAKALAVDPRSSLALYALAIGLWQKVFLGVTADPQTTWQTGIEASDLLIRLDRNSSIGYACKALFQIHCLKSTEESWQQSMVQALNNLDRAYDLNPHDINNLVALCHAKNLAGQPADVLEHAELALRLSPLDPLRFNIYYQLAVANFQLSKYTESLAYSALGLAESAQYALLHAVQAMSFVGLQDVPRARSAFDTARRLWPQWVERALNGGIVYRSSQFLAKSTIALRVSAGLEELSAFTSLERLARV